MKTMAMNKVEQAVLRHTYGDGAPRLSLRTSTRVDAGRWWRSAPLWLLVFDDSLLLLAADRRRYIEEIPFSDAAESYYCHQTGELVLAPCEAVTVRHVKMKASQAIRVLRLLGVEV
jgi:hypothetical protein